MVEVGKVELEGQTNIGLMGIVPNTVEEGEEVPKEVVGEQFMVDMVVVLYSVLAEEAAVEWEVVLEEAVGLGVIGR